MADALADFLIKRYRVGVVGFTDTFWFAASPGKARAKAWDSYRVCDDCSFKRFLQISVVRRDLVVPTHFGKEIQVGGEKAYYVSENGQYIQFVRPGEEVILNSHPLDVFRSWEKYGGDGSVPF